MDIYQNFGSDIVTSVKGDLQTVDGITQSQQRILRRLLTNPGDYIYHTDYGAGLPRYVGQALSPALLQEIRGLINGQVLLEASVAKFPVPVITLQPITDGLFCQIQYVEAASKTTQALAFQVTK